MAIPTLDAMKADSSPACGRCLSAMGVLVVLIVLKMFIANGVLLHLFVCLQCSD